MNVKNDMLLGAGFLTPAKPPEPLYVNGKKANILAYGHEMVVKLARDMAHELYDTMMRKNEAWTVWKHFCQDLSKDASEAEFVACATPHLLGDARATLASMLGQPRYAHLHDSLYDALMKDNLIRGTNGLVPVKARLEEVYQDGRQ